MLSPTGHTTPSVCSAAQSTASASTFSTPHPAPATLPGQVRPAAFAGTWYPADPDDLTATVDGLLAAVQPVDGNPIALIVPHAGYTCSGAVAAHAFAQLQGEEYDVAVIVAADHRPPLSDSISVWAEGAFATPLGIVPVDADVAQALLAADPRIAFDPAVHEGEHAIEAQLPFLQRACPGCRTVPVLMGSDDENAVQALSTALLTALKDRRAVVIASADLCHFPAYEDALAVDGATLGAIETGDPAWVRKAIDDAMDSDVANLATCTCGEGPILVAMRVAQVLGANAATVLRYANSGDLPSGDRQRVVGYGAVMLWRYDPPDLTQAQQEELMTLARAALADYLTTGRIPDYETADPVLARRLGVFVTLRTFGQLRGCMGRVWADTPLYRIIQEMTVAAATCDPRFPPLTADELDEVNIKISVLSPLRRLTDIQQIEIGTHGLAIVHAGRRGMLLPQVAVERGWDREEFLRNLCYKAGLPSNCWTRQPTLYTFTTAVFGEGE